MSASVVKTFVGGYTFKIVTTSDMNPSEKDWHIIAMFDGKYLVTDMHPDDVERFTGGVPELLLRALADELVADYGAPYHISASLGEEFETLWLGDEDKPWFLNHLIQHDELGLAWVDHLRAAKEFSTIAEAMPTIRQILADVQTRHQYDEAVGFELRLYDAQERPVRDFQPSYASWHAQWDYDDDGRQKYVVLP